MSGITLNYALSRLIAIKHEIAKGGDKEALHSEADDILTSVLAMLGHSDIAEAFQEAAKDFWYA